MKLKTVCVALASCGVLLGCATGANQRADVFRADQVNQEQEIEIVQIMLVQPAKVAVPNSSGKKAGQIGLGVLGAAAGALIGNTDAARIAGGVAGAAVGAAAGEAVMSGERIVDGVSIAYKKEGIKKVLHAVQAGNVCEFKLGDALMVFTKDQYGKKEARIQPNNPGGCE